MAIVRYLLVSAFFTCVLACDCVDTCSAAVVSSTENQDGSQIFIGSEGSASKIGTFVLAPVAEQYLEVRLRTWVELSEQSIGADAPQLVFSPYNELFPSISFIFGAIYNTNVYTELTVENLAPVSLGVEDRQSIWIPLTGAQSDLLKGLIAADPLGRVDAWLYNPTNPNFFTPSEISYFEIGPNGELVPVTEVFTATIEFVAIPEPNSCIVASGLLLTYFGYRRKRKPVEGSSL